MSKLAHFINQNETRLRFDYSQIEDDDTREAMMGAAITIIPRMEEIAENIVIIGRELVMVKDGVPHGFWLKWLDEEFCMEVHQARRWMHVGERFGYLINDDGKIKNNNLLDLKKSVLYELAAPSTPARVIEEVEQMLAEEKPVNLKTVRELKSNARYPGGGLETTRYEQHIVKEKVTVDPKVEVGRTVDNALLDLSLQCEAFHDVTGGDELHRAVELLKEAREKLNKTVQVD